jgi:RNA polymerase sigma-70 factor (ECF subfamily)
VRLSEQNTTLWSAPMLAEAEAVLLRASAMGRIGRFQLEAAIQSAHAARAESGRVEWTGIAMLYGALLRLAPTLGARVAHAAAIAEASGAAAGLALLEAIEGAEAYQPWWAVRAHLLARLGRPAAAAYAEAARLAGDGAIRRFLEGKARQAAPF